MKRYEYREGMSVGRVCFELSLKPFKRTDEAYIEATCRELFEQWKPLLRYASSCAVMLWTADGSEILDYAGSLEDTFEWCKWIGIANPMQKLEEGDIRNESLHVKPVPYTDNPPEMTYGDLKNIISALKRVGREETELEVEVGETFDPGPEFAYSDFKYHRHTEISLGDIMGSKNWIHCAVRLKSDERKYAAFPNGIPEGLHFGTFLARQFKCLKDDVGFDYIWLSNGFGYSLNSWNWTGELFDGQSFDFKNASRVRNAIVEFWQSFTRECGCRIETRGSNLSSGMDMAAHGSPIKEIYSYGITAPPNSPWAAMDHRFGLELAGYMSHIAVLPRDGYLFRYYIHDPWWLNSPWFDRYDRSPHDIYMPLSITRLDGKGGVTPPRGVNFLSVDDSYGDMPRRCPTEVTPHVLNAYNDYPDEAGAVTWVYPFDYYDELALQKGRMDKIFMDDWLIESALDEGLPLNSVISDRDILNSDYSLYNNTVLLMPVPEQDSALEEILRRLLKEGNKVLLYGSVSLVSDWVKGLIGVHEEKELDGELELKTILYHDSFNDGDMSATLRHSSALSGGGISTVSDGGAEVTSTVSNSEGERVYSTYNPKALDGQLAWVRGSFPHGKGVGHLPGLVGRREAFKCSVLLRGALERFGVTIRFKQGELDTRLPLLLASRRDNAYLLTAFAKDTDVKTVLSLPEGAPIINGMQAKVDAEGAEYSMSRSFHEQCRVLVRQMERSTVRCNVITSENIKMGHRLSVSGLRDATLTFLPPKGSSYRIARDDGRPFAPTNVPLSVSQDGKRVSCEGVSGTVYIAWSI
ncbi:MAG: hypothetical protein AB9835_02945 [Eubacteriales bacterium]